MEEKFGHLRDKLKDKVPVIAEQARLGLETKLKEAKAALTAAGSVTDPNYDGPHIPDQYSGTPLRFWLFGSILGNSRLMQLCRS